MRLTLQKPRLGSKAPRLGYLPGDAVAADQSRNRMSPWREWYKTERWRKLKRQVHERDQWRCQRTGRFCVGKYPAENSAVANHKVPHRGDPALFWDINNIETVTKKVHDGLIQSEERQRYPGG